ncbi:MAG TPA: pyridoxamine 5'-phosphate oxidase [Thermomicrobiales bacterium]|nr:pyridoxamine 5'-phosphate oxidase [Thermomicrobiales bacterium]
MANTISSMRLSYELARLGDRNVDRDPMLQFTTWFTEVCDTAIAEANAMVISTVGADNVPSSRAVLLKQFDQRGFVFFTNYESQKGRELAHNPHVAALFYWPTLQRQVRIVGVAEPISATESDHYFASRPRGSQLGAAVSPQSEPIPDRHWLEERFAEAERALGPDGQIARPAHWGGYRIAPQTVEFWQGRPNRLHDRIRYRRGDEGEWTIERLAP